MLAGLFNARSSQVAIIPGGQPTAVALENFDTQTGSTYTWMVDIAAGTSVTVRVTDGTGAVKYVSHLTSWPS